MALSKVTSTNKRVVTCDFCYTPVSSAVDGDIVWAAAFVMCPNCLALVPEPLATKFLDTASWPIVKCDIGIKEKK